MPDSPVWSGQRVVVTGGAGFIASHLVQALVRAGADVTAVVRQDTDTWRLASLGPRIRIVRADVRELNERRLQSELGGTDIVYHLAASGVDQRQQDGRSLLDVNVGGTWAALTYAEQANVSRFVYCGSCFEYGQGSAAREEQPARPTTDYAVSKLAGWSLAQAFGRRTGLPVVGLRPFTAYGPLERDARLVPFVVSRALTGETIALTSGSQTRDFVYIADVVDAFLTASVASDVIGEIFNVCTGVETSVRSLVMLVLELTGSAAVPVFGSRPNRAHEIWSLSGSTARARDQLGWSAQVTLREGLSRTIASAIANAEREGVLT